MPYLRLKGKAMIERDFAPMFRLTLAAKDARLAAEAAGGSGLDLPLLRTIEQRLAEGAKEHGDLDFSATYLTSAPSHRR
jgi:3-hydroxyisobutyrate dehydrogenase-like beta-hydroxyacid dehydrogenase